MMSASRFVGLLGCCAVGAAIAARPATAEVIVYDNSDGEFLWLDWKSSADPQNHLDITLPPTQSGEPTSRSLVLTFFEGGGGSTTLYSEQIKSSGVSGTARVAQVAVPLSFSEPFFPGLVKEITVEPAFPFAPGQLIAGDASWMSFATYSFGAPAGGSIYLLGESITIGVRVEIKGRSHYGWIRFSDISQPLAWAYETEPDVPIPAGGEVDADGVLHVPGEYPSVRAAMNNAVSGQTILVADGIYTGMNANGLDFHGKAITLRSVGGSHACVLEPGSLWPTRGFHFHSGETAGSVIDGFTIRNCISSSGGGGAIRCASGSSPTITHCMIIDVARGIVGGNGE